MSIFKILIICIFFICSLNAESSKEYAKKGRLVWSAFECSIYASKIDKMKEAENLFNLGYKNGLDFIDALKLNKIEEKDLSEEVPVVIKFLLSGPNADFILGRIYEVSVDNVYKNVDLNTVAEIQRNKFIKKYTDSNCSLIGK